MRLPENSIESLKLIVKRLYGSDITSEEAHRQGIAILRFIALQEISKNDNGNGTGVVNDGQRKRNTGDFTE